MRTSADFLMALTVVLGVSAMVTVLFQRLRQPVILGYLIAGLIIGPHVPIPLVADREIVETLSELGVLIPTAQEELKVGDLLALAGTHEALALAKELLGGSTAAKGTWLDESGG